MSRRSVTTLTIQVRLRTPPGSNTAAMLEFVRAALDAHEKRLDNSDPIAALDLDSMIVKLEKKETTYL